MRPVARRPVAERLRRWLTARAMGIRKGDGTAIESIRTGDGRQIAEVRRGDGTVVWQRNAILDSAVFDGWDDGKLTSRDDYDTVAYEYESLAGGLNDTRPEWSIDNNDDATVTNSELEINFSSAANPDGIVGTQRTQNFDTSVDWRMYLVTSDTSSESFEELIHHVFTDDVTVRGGTSISIDINAVNNEIILTTPDGTATTVSQSMSTNTYYGFVLDRVGDSYEVYFDPADPSNPDSSERIISETNTADVDTSTGDAGTKITTAHGGSSGKIRRLEIFPL